MLSPGTTVAGYRIDGVLGEGGMGVVYRATQLSLNRVVALKLLAPEFGDDPGFRTRFQREGQLQAALDHQHIVTVFEAGQTEHGLFLAMRLIDGPTLKELILKHQIDPRGSLRVLAQVAQALDAAHLAGLIHRDVKPQNILIGKDDHAYLADFGLIKAPDDARITGTGQFLGTIDYIAPEQIQGEPATGAGDCYALTAVLYECLTGEVPFPRNNEVAVLHAHMTEPPPRPSERNPELSPAIDHVIATGMAKDPAARPPTASELIRQAMSAFVGGTPTAPAGSVLAAGASPGASKTKLGAATALAPAASMTVASPAGATRPAGSATPATPEAAAARVPAAPRARPGVRGAGVLVALAGAVIAAGFVVGHSGASKRTESFPNSATVGTVELRYPSDWRLAQSSTAIPGLTFADPLRLTSASGTGSLTAGEVPTATGATLLPAAFRGKLDGALPTPVSVRLGTIDSDRYAGLRVRGQSGAITIYAVPTSAGVATLACWGTSSAGPSFQTQCGRVAATIRLLGVNIYPLGPSGAYAQELSSVLQHLRTALSRPLADLQSAGSPGAQASAARRVSSAYTTAGKDLTRADVTPMVRDVNAKIVAALVALAGGYEQAASAASSGSTAAYGRAGTSIHNGSNALDAALRSLSGRGYNVVSG